MKIDRHGQAKILSQEEIQLLFRQGLLSTRDRTLFGVCLFSGCRIREACTLLTMDVYDKSFKVRPKLLIRKGNTKGKLATRTIPIIEDLRRLLTNYKPEAGQPYLFPGRSSGHISPDSAARLLRQALERVGIEGASTHSFRRTAITLMSDAGIPLKVIQEVSGHRNLQHVQGYIEVRESQVLGAVSALSMLSPVEENVGKWMYPDITPAPSSLDTPTPE